MESLLSVEVKALLKGYWYDPNIKTKSLKQAINYMEKKFIYHNSRAEVFGKALEFLEKASLEEINKALDL